MIDKTNAWAKRWAPLIMLVGVVFAGLALIVGGGRESTEVPPETAKPVASGLVLAAPKELERLPDILPLTDRSLQKNFDEYNVYGLQIDCEYLIARKEPAGLNEEQRSAVDRFCLKGSSRSIFVNHFSSKVRDREMEILRRSADILNIANARPVIVVNELDKCLTSNQEDAIAVFSSSWLSIALKAFWLAEAGGQGGKVTEALKAGSEPFEALPEQQDFGGIPKVQYLSKSVQVLTNYQIDQFIGLYTDEELLAFSGIVLDLIPEKLKEATLHSARKHLERYPEFKARSANRYALYEQLYVQSRYVEINSGKLIGASPQGTVYSSCLDEHIDRFWFRRLLNGTDERFAKLAEKLLVSSGPGN